MKNAILIFALSIVPLIAAPPKPVSVSGSQVWTNENGVIHPLTTASLLGLSSDTNVLLIRFDPPTTGNNDIYFGQPPFPSSEVNDLAFGYYTLHALNSGSDNSGFGGLNQLITGDGNTSLGSDAGGDLLVGNNNTFVGKRAGYFNGSTNSNLSCFGFQTLLSLNDDASPNDAFGSESLTADTEGIANVAMGFRSGYSATVGSSNVFLGHLANASAAVSNAIVIGHSITATANNQVKFGNVDNDFHVGVEAAGVAAVNVAFALRTNYTASNFTPISGYTFFVGSNNAIYSVSTTKTNLIAAP